MQTSELDQLPWFALIDEARRRGVSSPEALERRALIDALMDARAVRGGRTPLSRARSLLGRVVDSVRSALPAQERRSERPPPSYPSSRPGATSASASGPTLAELAADVARATSTEDAVTAPLEVAAPLGPVEPLATPGVRIDADGGLAWNVPESALTTTREIAPEGAELRLHVVRVAWDEAAEGPRTTREDRGVVELAGTTRIAAPASDERLVIALGLGLASGEFVAVAHATHG